jgi:hypothetical protein
MRAGGCVRLACVILEERMASGAFLSVCLTRNLIYFLKIPLC